jgi:hypothetical protein
MLFTHGAEATSALIRAPVPRVIRIGLFVRELDLCKGRSLSSGTLTNISPTAARKDPEWATPHHPDQLVIPLPPPIGRNSL